MSARDAFAVAVLVCCGAAQAQPAPGAATAPRSTTADAAFVLRGVEFRGNTRLGEAALSPLAQRYIGKRVSLADLEQLAADVTQLYRERGYFLAQAIVPQQAVKDGVAEISVLEGKLGRLALKLADDAPIGERRVRGLLGTIREGDAFDQRRFERAMLLLSDQPGLKVQSGLQQGLDTGTTDWVVEVDPAARRWQASAAIDDYGSRSLGRYRWSAFGRFFSPLGIGDNLDAHVMRTVERGQTFGRLGYELPVGYDGLRAGVGYARVSYELGEQFAALGASGTARVADVSASYPIIRSRTKNLFFRGAFEHKSLSDTTAAVGLETDKDANAASAALSWESRDAWWGGGYTSGGITIVRGRLTINDSASLALDQSDVGHRTQGDYSKVTAQASRLQALFGRNNLFVSLLGQWSNRNLDPSEKVSLGGDRAVRAYPIGEVLVDVGVVASIEWRYSVSDDVVIAPLFDIGHGWQWRHPLATDTRNTRTLRGSGVSVSWSAPHGFTLLTSISWRHGSAPASESGNDDPRILAQLQKTF